VLAGCSATPTPRPTDTAIEAFEPIRYSAADTCATQKRIAEHNSVYDTLKRGKRVVYAAPCEIEAGSGEPDAGERKVADARMAQSGAGE
jgi:hypothetical protein